MGKPGVSRQICAGCQTGSTKRATLQAIRRRWGEKAGKHQVLRAVLCCLRDFTRQQNASGTK